MGGRRRWQGNEKENVLQNEKKVENNGNHTCNSLPSPVLRPLSSGSTKRASML